MQKKKRWTIAAYLIVLILVICWPACVENIFRDKKMPNCTQVKLNFIMASTLEEPVVLNVSLLENI